MHQSRYLGLWVPWNNDRAQGGWVVTADTVSLTALSNAPFHPHTWWRYLGDVFMIWTEGLDHLKIFVDYLNNIHPTIKFTSNHSLTNVPFLDVMVYLHNGPIETDLYTKPTDKHQHLLSSLCNTQHIKKAIPVSLALRLRGICSTDVR